MSLLTQYLYPIGMASGVPPNTSVGWVNEHGNTNNPYQSINQGVEMPNDLTYLWNSGTVPSTDMELKMIMTPFSVIPDAAGYISVRFRYRNDYAGYTAMSCGMGFLDANNNLTYFFLPINNFPSLTYTNGNYVNVEFPMYSYNGLYGYQFQQQYQDVITQYPSGVYLTFNFYPISQPAAGDNVYLSEIEIVSSGTYKAVPNKVNTLYVGASLPLSSGSTLYEYGNVPIHSGNTLYECGPLPVNNEATVFWPDRDITTGYMYSNLNGNVTATNGVTAPNLYTQVNYPNPQHKTWISMKQSGIYSCWIPAPPIPSGYSPQINITYSGLRIPDSPQNGYVYVNISNNNSHQNADGTYYVIGDNTQSGWTVDQRLLIGGPSGNYYQSPEFLATSGIYLYIDYAPGTAYQEFLISSISYSFSGNAYIPNGPSYTSLYACGPSGSNNNINLYTYCNKFNNNQYLNINYLSSKVHASGTFTPSGIFRDTFFDFSNSGSLVNAYDPYFGLTHQFPVFTSEIGSGTLSIYTPPGAPGGGNTTTTRYNYSPSVFSGTYIPNAAGTLTIEVLGGGGAGTGGGTSAGGGGGGGGYTVKTVNVRGDGTERFLWNTGRYGQDSITTAGNSTVTNTTYSLNLIGSGGFAGGTANRWVGGVGGAGMGGDNNYVGGSGVSVPTGNAGGNGGIAGDGASPGASGGYTTNVDGQAGGMLTGLGNGGGGGGIGDTNGGYGGGGNVQFILTTVTYTSSSESGWSQIFAPGFGQDYAFSPIVNSNECLVTTDGTTAHFSSADQVVTNPIIPAVGNYSLYLSAYGQGLWNGIIDYNYTLPSGSVVNFDGCRIYYNGDLTASFQTNTVNVNLGYPYPAYLSPANPGDIYSYQDYIVSYNGNYNVWGCYCGTWTKLYTGPSIQRSSISSPGIYTGNSGTDLCLIYKVQPQGPSTLGQVGLNKIGVVASGISDGDIGILNLSQASMGQLLTDLSPHPSGFVRYDALQANRNSNGWASPYNNGLYSYMPASYLPFGRVPSGATNANYIDNYGTFKLQSVLNASGIGGIGGTPMNMFPVYGYTSSGLIKVYDKPAGAITYSGWINSNFSGDFVVSLSKDASVYTFNNYSFNGGTSNIVNSSIRYKSAFDIITVLSGNYLYVKPFANLVEANFDESRTTTSYTGGGGYTYDNVTQYDGGINWDQAVLKTISLNPYTGSGIIEYKADINNAVIFTSYLSGPTPATGAGMPLFVNGLATTHSGCDMFLDVATPTSSGTTLFTLPMSSGLNGMTLLTGGKIPLASGTSLFVLNLVNNNCDLFIKAYDPVFATGGLSLNVWTSGSPAIITPSGGGMSLWMEQAVISSGYAPLYINSTTQASGNNNAPLYTFSQQPSGWNQITMYTNSPLPAFSGLQLYMGSNPSGMASTTLYTKNSDHDVWSNAMSLSIANVFYPTGTPNYVNLYTSANFQHADAPLFMKATDWLGFGSTGTLPPSLFISTFFNGNSTGNSANLYIGYVTALNSGLPIYMNSQVKGNFNAATTLSLFGLFGASTATGTFFIQGPQSGASAQRLWIQGATSIYGTGTTLFTRNKYNEVFNNQMQMYIQNRVNASGSTSLYTVAGNFKSSIPMFIDTQVPNLANNSMTLLTNSMGPAGYFIYNGDAFSDPLASGKFYPIIYPSQTLAQMGMYIGAVGLSKGTTLFMPTMDRGSYSGQIPLFISSANTSIGNSVPLYMESVRQAFGSINFNIGGYGQLTGGNILASGTPLFMARPSNAYGAGQNLYMNGPSGNNFNVPMFISGGTLSYGQMNLSLAVSKGIGSGNQTIYTHGF